MVKKSLFSILFLLHIQFLQAMSETYHYMGAWHGTGTGIYSSKDSLGLSASTNIDLSIGSLKIGMAKEFRELPRIELSLLDIDVIRTDGSLDNISSLELNVIEENEDFDYFIPYTSLGFGLTTWDDTAYIFTNDTNLSGTSINLGVGFFLLLGENLELDIGYKYRLITWSPIESGTTTYDLEHGFGVFYAGLNYKIYQ